MFQKKEDIQKRFYSKFAWSFGFIFLCAFLVSTQAIAAPPALTYQGRILKSDGTPLEYNNVRFIFKIMDPSGQCIIYQEQVDTVDMTNSAGLFDVPIGQGTVSYPTSGTFTVLESFNNSSPHLCMGGSPYVPVSTDGRILRVSFYDGEGWKTITPDNKIRSVPYAGYSLSAQKLGDYTANDFLTKVGLPTCGAGTFLTWNGAVLSCAAVSGSSGGTVTDVTSANSYLTVASGTSTPVLTVNVGNTSGTLASGDDPRFASAIQSGGAAGGVLTGTYPNPGLANNSVNTVNINNGAVTTAKLFPISGINQIVATDSATGNTLSALTCGVGQLLIWDAALGWQCVNQSSLAVGSASLAGSAINFSGSLSGDVTGTQSATVVSKIGGYAVDLSVAPTSNQVLTWNGSKWMAASIPAGGTVTSVTSANGDISIATGTSTPVLTLNSGNGANQIVKLDGSAKLPAVDASQLINLQATQIPNLDASKITSGVFAITQGGTGQSTYTDGQLLIGNSVGNTLTKATLTAGSGISITNGNGSIAIANTGLTGLSTFSGDISGTSSTTSVDKIKGTAVSTTSPTLGQFLVYDGTTQYDPVSMSGDATMSNTGAVTLKNTGTAGTYYKITTDAQGRVTSGSNLVSGDITTALSFTPLNKAGDVMTGTLGVFTTASDPAGLVAGDVGKIWYNTTANQLKYWDGSAAQSLGVAGSGLSLNGQTGGTQAFATPGAAGTAPNWSSATNTHTLNIPMANTAGVTAGLISKAEYDTFNSKLGTGTTFSGDVSGAYNSTSVDKIKGVGVATSSIVTGQVLRFDGTNWVNAAVNAASDLSGIVPVANGGTGASSLGSGGLLVGAGAAAVTSLAAGSVGNVVYATGISSWSSGTPDTAGLVDKSSTQTISGVKAFSNYVQLNTQNEVRFADADSSNYVALRSPTTVSANVTWTLPAADGAAGQILKTDGAGNLSWINDAAGTGTVTSVSSANTDIGVATGATTPVLTLNSGTAGGAGDANKIVKLDANGLLATAMIPSLDTAKISTGTLPVARGGTNSSTALVNNRIMASDGGAIVEAPAITADKALISNVNGIPTHSAVSSTELGYLSGVTSAIQTQINGKASSGGWTNYSVIGVNGVGALTAIPGSTSNTMLQYSPTGPVWSTASYPNSTTANQLLYSSSNNVVNELATANNAVLTTNGSGVPSWSVLSNDLFSQYALLAGRPSGQTLNGGTAANENLTLDSTSNATKGNVLINPGGGKVGIGTTSPTRQLHIYNVDEDSEARLGNYLYLSGTSGGAPSIGFNGYYDGSAGGVYKFGESSVNRYASMIEFDPIGGGLTFFNSTAKGNAGATVTYASRLKIAADGNVGIGTTSPSAKLDISGGNVNFDITNGLTSDTGAQLKTGTAGRTWQTWPGDSGSASFIANLFDNSIAFIVANNGNVGIGTDTPSTKVEVNGNLNIYSESSWPLMTSTSYSTNTNPAYFMTFAARGGNKASPLFTQSGDVMGYFESRSLGVNTTSISGTGMRIVATENHTATTMGSELKLKTVPNGTKTSVDRLIITESGKVGIGTTSPVAQFHTYTSAAGEIARFDTTNTGNSWIRVENGSAYTHIGVGSLTPHGYAWSSTGKYFIGADGSPSLWVDQTAGKVGIGTTTPAVKLHVGTAAADEARVGTLSFNGNSSHKLDEYFGVRATLADSAGGNGFRVNSSTGQIFAVKSNGRVGIGTDAPGYQLTLSTDSAAKPGTSTWTIASDARLKDIRAPFNRGLAALEEIHPIYFTYKSDNPLKLPSDKEYVGIIAQDAQKAVPESVHTDDQGYLHLTNDAILWTIVNSVKELYHKVWGRLDGHERTLEEKADKTDIAQLRVENDQIKLENQKIVSENRQLQNENAEIKARLERIEKMLQEK